MRQEIEQLLHERAVAVKAKDIEKAGAFYETDLRVFDLVNPLERAGSDGVKERLAEWVASFKEIKDYSFTGLEIDGNADFVICSLFDHVEAIKPDGSSLDMWWRETLGLQKKNGKWLIIHTHASVPFDPAN